MSSLSNLVIDLQPGDRLALDGVTVELVHKSGRVARLRVIAPRTTKIEKKRSTTLCEVVPRMAESSLG